MTFAALLLLAAFPPDPYIGYINPSAVAVGTTNRLVVGGQYFNRVSDAWVSGGGVTILGVEEVPRFPYADSRQSLYLKGWLDAIARGETAAPPMPELKPTDVWRTNRWWQTLGSLGPVERELVERELWVRRDPLQSAPSLASRLIVTVAVAPDAAPGRRQFRVYRDNALSEPRPLDVVTAPVTAEPRYLPPSRKAPERAPLADFPCVFTGCIMPGETDVIPLRLKRGRGFSVTVTGRAYQPYIGDAVPGFFNPAIVLKGPDGRELAFADDYAGMDPDPRLVCDIPADGDYTLELHDVLYRGREDFVYTVSFAEGASAAELSTVALPLERTFELSAPARRVIDVKARRLGSMMDPRITLTDDRGRVVGVWDDVTNAVHFGSIVQTELDPVVCCDLPAGRYTVSVDDTCGRRGPGVFCELDIRPPRPSFRLTSHRSGFALGEESRWPHREIKFSVERFEGFDGPITLRDTADVKFRKAVIPAHTNEWEVTARCVRKYSGEGPKEFEIAAVGKSAAGEVHGEVVAADEYDQAFAWRHLLSFGKFVYLCKRVPKPAQRGK